MLELEFTYPLVWRRSRKKVSDEMLTAFRDRIWSEANLYYQQNIFLVLGY